MFICNCQIPNNAFLYCTESKHLKKRVPRGCLKQEKCDLMSTFFDVLGLILRTIPKNWN